MSFNQKEQEIIKYGLQNGKSQQEVEKAISNYRLGIKTNTQEIQPTTPVEDSSLVSRVKEDIKQGQEKVQEIKQSDNSSLTKFLESTANITSLPIKVAGEVLPEPVRKGIDWLGQQVGKVITNASDKLSETQLFKDIGELEAKGYDMPEVKKLKDILTGITAGSETIGNIAVLEGGIKATNKVTDLTKTGVNKVKQGAVDTTKEFTGDLSKVGNKITENLSTAPESIMNKVARVTPKEAQTFKSMTGKDIGTYLTEKGNFNSPSKIVTTEAETFTKTLADKEATLAKLKGNFKSGVIDDTLQALKDRAIETSSKNVKAPYLKQVEDWITKAKSTGLTMEEINNAKKLFEREVKLGYNKLTDAPKIKQATYLDDALRTFQDETASKLGFTNIKDLSKQIQASKFIVDKLGNKLVSNDLLNGVSLTDYIILAGGEPSSVGAFLTKKIFSNKGIQAKIAKALSNKEVKAPVKANYSPQATKAIQTKNISKKIISK